MYSYLKDNNTGSKTAKGIKKIVIKNIYIYIKHDNYKDVLINKKHI